MKNAGSVILWGLGITAALLVVNHLIKAPKLPKPDSVAPPQK